MILVGGFVILLCLGKIARSVEICLNSRRQNTVRKTLDTVNNQLIEEKNFMLDCSPCCSTIFLYRTAEHPENHLFKSREKLAPIGPMVAYELSSVKKKLTNADMRVITEEDEEMYFPSMINSNKKPSRMQTDAVEDFEKDFQEGNHKIDPLPKLEKARDLIGDSKDVTESIQQYELKKATRSPRKDAQVGGDPNRKLQFSTFLNDSNKKYKIGSKHNPNLNARVREPENEAMAYKIQ